MRLFALLLTAILTVVPAWAQPTQPTSGAESSSSAQDAKRAGAKDKDQEAKDQGPAPDLPVSLDKIREALKAAPAQPLRGLNEQRAHFKVEIQERQKIEELLATLDFKSGPAVPGGLYAFEQQRLAHPPVDNPLMQPYAAFSTGQLLTLAIEGLIEKYLGGRVMNAVTSAERARAERAARGEVARAMAEFCAAQPNHGIGLKSCEIDSPDR